MSTLARLIQRTLDELNRSDLSAQVADAVSSAIVLYGQESWGFNDTSTATILAVGTYRYSLPADWVNETLICIDEDSRRSPLEKISFIEHQSQFDTLSTGTPSQYAIYGDNLYLWPIPDESLSLVLAYTFVLPDLSVSGSNAWTNEFEEVIRARASADVLENIIRGDDAVQQAIVCRAREAEALRRIRPKRVQQKSTRIRRRGML